jgi:transposase
LFVAGKTPVNVTQDRRRGLERLSGSANRPEADGARAILLSLAGWTSAEIGEAFGRRKLCEQRFRRVREDTVRDWRSVFMREGLVGIERNPAPGCPPVKAQAALSVAGELFAAPVADRANWTLPRLCDEIERRTGQRISHSRLSVVLRKKGALPPSGPVTR